MNKGPDDPKPMRLYLSYAAPDRKMAERMRAGLKKAGLQVWDIVDDVLPGGSWGAAVPSALETCNAMVALVSPSFHESVHVMREVEFALTHPRYRDRLIPVLVRPTTRFPWILKQLSFIDATQDPAVASEKLVPLLRQPQRKNRASTPA